MKPSRITATLGIVLAAAGVLAIVSLMSIAGIVPLIIGAALIYLAFNRGRVATLVFGHSCIVVGAYLITWGILLLPYSKPTIAHVFGRPLFWGIFSLMGGVCAIFHGFCRCVTKQSEQFEGIPMNSKPMAP
ncbi:MAG: hypothetical protein NTV06_05085 [candidate division Zixibacteria bacterium]|nr:hypothetical protein [candidate division Zixibacteria bacterium]